MRKRNIIQLTVLMAIICLMGTGSYAERTIDKLKFPPINEITMPDVDKIPLDNGMMLYIVEDHELPIVRASVLLAAGGYLDPPAKVGLADIVGSVMRTGGTARMTGDEIDEALESIGASVEVGIGTTTGSASMNILSEYTDTGLEILADILRTPQFAEDKIDIAKSAARTAISSRNDEPFDICIREFRKAIYGADSPYARQNEYGTINAITRDDLLAYHGKYVTPENVMLAVWGDFDKTEMIAKIKQYFGDWPAGAGKVPPLPEVKYEFKPFVHYIEKENVTQSSVLIGHIGGLTGDPDYYAMTVANTVLGSSFAGRIFKEVRSRQGLAYSTAGNFTTNIAYPGIYYNYVITKLESTVHASQAILNEINRLEENPPTEEELNLAKNSYLNSFVFRFDSKGEVINRMMTYDLYDFPQDFLFKVRENLEKVTAEDVVDVVKRRIHTDQMQIVVVGNDDEFDELLSVLGPVDTIDITIPTGEPEVAVEINEETLAKGMDILSKAVEACGGVKNYQKVKTIYSEKTVSLVTPQGEIALSSKSRGMLPGMSLDSMVTPFGLMISVSDGENAWMKQGPQVVQSTPEEMKDNDKEQFRNTILLFQKADNPDYQVVYIGSDELNGKPVEMLQIMSADGGTSFKLAVDAETYLPAGKYYFGKTIMGPGSLVEIYSDIRNVEGIKIPFNTVINSDGKKAAEVSVQEYRINPKTPKIDESIFVAPQ